MTALRTGAGLAAVMLAASAALVPADVRAADIGIDLHAGTLGLGLGLRVDARLSRHVGIRVGFNRFRSGSDWEEDDLDYDAGSTSTASTACSIDTRSAVASA